ncbi:hypothetical protein [Paraburkholderia diazotrophica]|uniref:hypothetical protein n=1 Tax=Paraburkholderia diazotrophica TaxID=667676 RepID=UPI00317BE993
MRRYSPFRNATFGASGLTPNAGNGFSLQMASAGETLANREGILKAPRITIEMVLAAFFLRESSRPFTALLLPCRSRRCLFWHDKR